MFTEQEMWDNWNSQIEANQRALGINSTGDKMPTDSVDKVRAMREKAFLGIGKNASENVKKAWLDAADEIGMDGQGFSSTGTLDHPLEPYSTRSSKVIAAREKERAFYERFIEKLMGMTA